LSGKLVENVYCALTSAVHLMNSGAVSLRVATIVISAKRARKPLADISANRHKELKESGATTPAETFMPFSHWKPELAGEPRVPKGTELSPLATFSLYWGDEILNEIAITNLYAESKQNGILTARASRPSTRIEAIEYPRADAFPSATIFMNVASADYRSRAFTNIPKGSMPLRRYERNWLCLFFFPLDVSLNSHIPVHMTRDETFIEATNADCNPATTPFRQASSATNFRRLLAKELIGTKAPRKQRVRHKLVSAQCAR